MDETNLNHIGEKSWRKLTRGQQQSIIKDRKNARKLYDAYMKERGIVNERKYSQKRNSE